MVEHKSELTTAPTNNKKHYFFSYYNFFSSHLTQLLNKIELHFDYKRRRYLQGCVSL